MSLLESVMLHHGTVDAETAARDAAALGPLHDGTGTEYATEVTAAIRVVAELGLSERRERGGSWRLSRAARGALAAECRSTSETRPWAPH